MPLRKARRAELCAEQSPAHHCSLARSRDDSNKRIRKHRRRRLRHRRRRLSESISTNPEGQVEASCPRDQAEALVERRRTTGASARPSPPRTARRPNRSRRISSGGGYDALADSIQAVTQNKEAYPKSVRKAGGAFLAATAATLGNATRATSKRRWSSTSPR